MTFCSINAAAPAQTPQRQPRALNGVAVNILSKGSLNPSCSQRRHTLEVQEAQAQVRWPTYLVAVLCWPDASKPTLRLSLIESVSTYRYVQHQFFVELHQQAAVHIQTHLIDGHLLCCLSHEHSPILHRNPLPSNSPRIYKATCKKRIIKHQSLSNSTCGRRLPCMKPAP